MIAPSSLIRHPSLQLSYGKVALIVPPSCFLLDERVFVSLGVLKVAAVLEQAGIQVEVLDLSGVQDFEDAVEKFARSTSARAVGITATTAQMPAARIIAEKLRQVLPSARTIIGGPHPTLTHAAVKQERKAGRVGRAHEALHHLEAMFDVIVAGDGEQAVFVALAETPPKIVDADDPKGTLFMTEAFYEETPWPARHLVDMSSYHYSVEGHRASNLVLQLGCPYGCRFCSGRSSPMLRRIRTRSTSNAVAEIEHLYRTYGLTGMMLSDDELNVNKEVVGLMNAIADLQERLGVEFRLRGFIKSELFTEEQAVAMYRAGFRWLLCGFEAGDPRILKNINKKATIDDNTRVMEIAAKYDLKVKALMSIGHAGETAETALAVRDWLLRVKPQAFDVTIISTYPGSPYYDEALPHASLPGVFTFRTRETGDLLHSIDVDFTKTADYYKGVPGEYKSLVFTEALSAERLAELRDGIEKEVRVTLNIPFDAATPGVRYEKSMGASGELPPFILRRSTVV